MTSAADTLKIDWEESVRIARAAEAAGIEALVPVARWRGFGGATNFNHRSFETMTWAAGLAAATERIGIFATVHVPTVHPVRAAKEIATIDHISRGRFALNIVAGWNEPEIRMFGVSQPSMISATPTPTSSRPCSSACGPRTISISQEISLTYPAPTPSPSRCSGHGR